MDRMRWELILEKFRNCGSVYDGSNKELFEEHEKLSLSETHDIVVLTSEPWRNDCAPMLLDYCLRQGIDFDTVNKHDMWMNINAFSVLQKVNISNREIKKFSEYLNNNDGPILNTKGLDPTTQSNHMLCDVDLNEVFFQYLIIKYQLTVDSIFTRNLDNVSLHNR